MLKIIIVLMILPLSSVCALAAPPITTDDPGTPGPGNWEINVGVTIDKRSEDTRYETPALDINYGIGDHIQLNYSASWIVLDSRGEATKNGLGNSEFAVKWRFLDQDKQGIDTSVYPRLIFNNPTSSANRGLADKGTTFRLPFQMEKKFWIITINAELGHDFRQRGGDEWLYGLAFKYAEIKGLEALAEVFGTANNSFKRHETVFNLGFRYDIGKNYTLLASAGRSLHSAPDQPDLLFYAGIQFRFGKSVQGVPNERSGDDVHFVSSH